MDQSDVGERLAHEEVVNLALRLGKLVRVVVEGGLQARWDHLDVDRVPAHALQGLLELDRLLLFFKFGHLVEERCEHIISYIAASDGLLHDCFRLGFVERLRALW